MNYSVFKEIRTYAVCVFLDCITEKFIKKIKQNHKSPLPHIEYFAGQLFLGQTQMDWSTSTANNGTKFSESELLDMRLTVFNYECLFFKREG